MCIYSFKLIYLNCLQGTKHANILNPSQEALYFENFDLQQVVTPVNGDKLEELLTASGYNKEKTEFLVKGFREGFDIGYRGSPQIKQESPNLKLSDGTETDLWNKFMKEVKLKRYAEPFEKIPYKNYIQSPIGLVPKDGGKDTHLILHLSYPRRFKYKSVNGCTPKEMCKVKYKDFDQAIRCCLEEGIGCKISKSDMKSAFRNLGIRRNQWKYLIMKARSPRDGRFYFFIDKCLPFSASVSCSHFQAFSDAVAHLVAWKTSKIPVNYLDDYLFIALLARMCNFQMEMFMEIWESIGFPVALEKTVWATTELVFLGLLINTLTQTVQLPLEKLQKGRQLINNILSKRSKKVTIKNLQCLCGFLNFLG